MQKIARRNEARLIFFFDGFNLLAFFNRFGYILKHSFSKVAVLIVLKLVEKLTIARFVFSFFVFSKIHQPVFKFKIFQKYNKICE